MSQEDVMGVEAAYEALTRSGLDAFADYWADDIEWRTMRARWDGKEAGRAYLHAVNEGVVLYLSLRRVFEAERCGGAARILRDRHADPRRQDRAGSGVRHARRGLEAVGMRQ
jgi:ketosteroid isomerase-like protein